MNNSLIRVDRKEDQKESPSHIQQIKNPERHPIALKLIKNNSKRDNKFLYLILFNPNSLNYKISKQRDSNKLKTLNKSYNYNQTQKEVKAFKRTRKSIVLDCQNRAEQELKVRLNPKLQQNPEFKHLLDFLHKRFQL